MNLEELPYLRKRQRNGRWTYYYRRGGKEDSLGVHGYHPSDPLVLSAYCVKHAEWENKPAGSIQPQMGSLAWAIELYTNSCDHWAKLQPSTQKSRLAIFKKYTNGPFKDKPFVTITAADINTTLYTIGGHGAVNHYKALKPVFDHLMGLGVIANNPVSTASVKKPSTKGFRPASLSDIMAFQSHWPVGTTERLIFDLGLYTGAARADLTHIGHANVHDNLLVYKRKKTGVTAYVPIKSELRRVIQRLPSQRPAFILNVNGTPYTPGGLGNLFHDAACAAGMKSRLHGLRKAFCVYWAEQGKSDNEIAAMAGHNTSNEVRTYTKSADRQRMIKLIADGR